MPLKDVVLTKKVERHIEKHGVTREEIIDVLNGFKYVRRKGKRFLFMVGQKLEDTSPS